VPVVIRFRLLLSVTDVNPRGSAGTREKVRGEGISAAEYLYRGNWHEVKAEFRGRLIPSKI
jgi:hypothetical protein